MQLVSLLITNTNRFLNYILRIFIIFETIKKIYINTIRSRIMKSRIDFKNDTSR